MNRDQFSIELEGLGDGVFELRSVKDFAPFRVEIKPGEKPEIIQAIAVLKEFRDTWTSDEMVANQRAIQATTRAEVAERKEAEARGKLEEAQQKIALFLTGGEASKVDVNLFAEWGPGMAVDQADVYRVGGVLYLAKKDHVTSEETKPGTPGGGPYWVGSVSTGEEEPEAPSVKYPKGTVTEYMGVKYKALKDTDKDPGQAPEDWEPARGDN